MGIVKKIKKKKAEKIQSLVFGNGLALFAFNLALTLALFFVFSVLLTLSGLLNLGNLALLLVPLLAIFLFASACGVVWYRFGQHLDRQFKNNKIFYAWLSGLVSILLLLILLFFIVIFFVGLGAITFNSSMILFGTLFITTMAVVFELPIITLGIITHDSD